jgi:hypothetical protein
MATNRTSFAWFATTVGGVVLVFASGFLVAGGSAPALVLMAAVAAGFLIGRVFSLPPRRPAPVRWVPPRPRPRPADSAATRQGRSPVPAGGRGRRR